MQRLAPLRMSSFGKVKMMAAALATRSTKAGVGFREQLVGDVAAGAAERELLGLGVRQIDQIGRGLADGKAVDLALELAREIVAAVGARGRGAERGREYERGEQRASEQVIGHENTPAPLKPAREFHASP